MRKLLITGLIVGIAAGLLTAAPAALSQQPVGVVGPADTDDEYALCARVFPDPQAYWPSPTQAPEQSPYAKGNAECRSKDFISYGDMVSGVTYLENLFPQFVEFYNLEQDFGTDPRNECASSADPQDYCSAGLPQTGVPSGTREKSELYLLRVTDERVSDQNKRFFAFPLSIHGIERAGAEAGVRATEDLAAWAYCEAVKEGSLLGNGKTNCTQEGAIPHPLLETRLAGPDNLTAGAALKNSAIYFIFANPDGWRRGDPDNISRFYQRYNGNGVDLNRDWPTIGFTYRPYTPWSEPESRSFGKVLKSLTPNGRPWDGGIDLHGQLIDRAFSFTLLGASERDYAKDQRILQTVKGAWADAEQRLGWHPQIEPNNTDIEQECEGFGSGSVCNYMYGVQWGTVWDTIDYTVTGSLGDWIDSPLGLGADGIDNEMSFSHLSNCGTGTCYEPGFEQLHVDGNKSLVYSMVNFTLLPEDTTFKASGKIGYVFNPKRIKSDGTTTPPPTQGLNPQGPILDQLLTPANNFTHNFLIKGPNDGFYNGGVEGVATPQNVQGISGESTTALVLERFKVGEQNPPLPNPPEGGERCATTAAENDQWEEVNRYFNQGSTYLQSGQAVHSNGPSPGWWRICMTGGLATQIAATGGTVDLDISFSSEEAWEEPPGGQLPYDVSNMELFESLDNYIAPGDLVPVNVDDVLTGAVSLDQFRSLVIADDPLPGYNESIPTGAAQEGQVHEPPVKAAATVPCAGDENSPPTCVADYEFTVDGSFNNQQLIVTLDTPEGVENDWDLYVQRKSALSGNWVTVGQSTTPTGNEQVKVFTPPPGEYRARIVNWAGTQPPTRLEIAFSNQYAGPPVVPGTRDDEDRDAWGAKLLNFVEGGGNLVLTDSALKALAYMGVLERSAIRSFSVYAGYIGFTRDGGDTDTYSDPLAKDVNQPGAAEGSGHRHQTFEPVPIGYAIQNADGADLNASPAWGVDQFAWESEDGRTAGTTTSEQVSFGELEVGSGVVRVIGALAPMPTDQYYHPFGLANYALTYTGYQVLNNALQWERPATDLRITKTDSPDPLFAGEELTYTIEVKNEGGNLASGVALTDTLPSSVEFVSSSSSCEGDSEVVCSLGAIASGASAQVTLKVKPTQAGTITNTASVSADNPDPNKGNNSDSETTTVKANLPDLTLSSEDITSSKARIVKGKATTLSAMIHNVGRADAQNVTVHFQVFGVRIGQIQTIPSIPVGGTGTASVTWKPNQTGDRRIEVSADFRKQIAELREDNNRASRVFTVFRR
jgi:uncharacterized repeat protein (TIGR01451 family)